MAYIYLLHSWLAFAIILGMLRYHYLTVMGRGMLPRAKPLNRQPPDSGRQTAGAVGREK